MQRAAPYFLALGLAVLLPTVTSAAEPGTETAKSSVVVKDGNGGDVTVSLDKGMLTMISTEDGHTSTRVVDLQAAGLLASDAIEGALAGLDDVFDELADLQLQFRLGQDNRLNLSYDDTDLELDLDQVMTQIASAVQSGLQELDTSSWTSRQARWDGASDEDLQRELADLKTEMEALRAELRQLSQASKSRQE